MELYKKYRPKNLKEFFGNEGTIKVLKEFISEKNLPSSIMIFGPTGCGKTTLARIIKNDLGCQDQDFTELNAANTRGIDTTREIIQQSFYYTFSGKPRIFLFDECHKLTNEASNSLLKILEDTPKNVYFILCTTDPQKVLPTIRSRCSPLQVGNLPSFSIFALLERICSLEGKVVSKEVMREISRASNGSPRNALVLLEEVLNLDPKNAIEFISKVSIGESKVGDLCKILMSKETEKWSLATKALSNLEDLDPEQIRISIMTYLSKVLIKSPDDRIGNIMVYFCEPFFNTGKSGLVLALWRALKI